MRTCLIAAVLLTALAAAAAPPAVRAYQGTLRIATYEPSGRETEPALFPQSTVAGLYPFTTYLQPFQPGGPKPKTYEAIFVENEYLRLAAIPEFGGRIFSVYDKLRRREMLYRNDVIKPAHYNPRVSWIQSGLELTGPHDLHMLTLHGEPFWSHTTLANPDGSVSLVLGATDPVYHMKVNLSATLHPGLAALEIKVYCFNPHPARMPQMLWINTAVPATPETRFLYQMTRTVGHTTADIAGWPVHNGIDYSWDRNNKHMLGVFGIDIYGDFNGAYHFDRDYGVFRFADRRLVQGMKLWTFGNGPGARNLELGYTDKAGPYVELQSGRHVWDGHYEWIAPHRAEGWSEWWIPVAGTGGATEVTRDCALNLNVATSERGAKIELALAAMRPAPGATVTVSSAGGELLRKVVALDPAAPVKLALDGVHASLAALRVTVRDASGRLMLDYLRPDASPGRKEYTPFTRPLESPKKATDQLGVEELVLAAENRQKELDPDGAAQLLEKALAADPANARALAQLGVLHFTAGRCAQAETRLLAALDRDPYSHDAHYYLAMARLALGKTAEAERGLFFIWPDSPYYAERFYYLGRIALARGDAAAAVQHLRQAVQANGASLTARALLAAALRIKGDAAAALAQLAELTRLDPTNAAAGSERYLISRDEVSKSRLLELLGRQSQEALDLASFYRDAALWADATTVMELVEARNADPWGTPPEFYYTLAYCQRRSGAPARAAASLANARAAAPHIDRFVYRASSEAPLAEAVQLDATDSVARFHLGCLLYFRNRKDEALAQWQAAAAIAAGNFSLQRALGLAYAELGRDSAAAHLEKAIALNPAHSPTLNDLSNLYARAGRLDQQIALLSKALARSPGDDALVEAILGAQLAKGAYAEAARIVDTHRFAPRHRTYGLRDKYRMLRYAQASAAFKAGNYTGALELYEAARKPPVSLGMDDFESQVSPRLQYYLGRTLEALGRRQEAGESFQRALTGIESLSGDRDSWNSENFFMLASLDSLGRGTDAAPLEKRFEAFALGEADSPNADHRAEARYLLALLEARRGNSLAAKTHIEKALLARPDLIPALLELRGDTLAVAPARH